MQRREEPNGGSLGHGFYVFTSSLLQPPRGGSLFAQLPGCIGHVTYGAVTAISDAITRPQTNREVGGGLVKGAPLTSAQEKVFRTHL